jgi:hypothetical protein
MTAQTPVEDRKLSRAWLLSGRRKQSRNVFGRSRRERKTDISTLGTLVQLKLNE